MKVRRIMLIKIHEDDDPKKAADLRHVLIFLSKTIIQRNKLEI
jgi:hypothetical protein